jgi:hypothetical protein
MMRFKHILGPSIPMSEARVWRMAKTRAFYIYTIAFAFIAALFHPYDPLHAAPLLTQLVFWTFGFAGFILFYTVIHLAILRACIRLQIKTISETFIMAATMGVLNVLAVFGFKLLGIEVTDAASLVSTAVFYFVLFEIAAYGYLSYGDRALFPEVYETPEAAREGGRVYEVFLRGTPLPVANVEMIRALDKGIEVTGEKQTYTAKRSLQVTLSELPVNMGIQIHRTIWVSRHLARNYINEGGTLYVVTSDGKRFPVARSRRSEFLAWIKMQD